MMQLPMQTPRGLDDHLVRALHQVKPDVVSAGALEQPCLLDRDLAVDRLMLENDATWPVRRDPVARQLPDKERDDKQHNHQGGGDEQDLTLPLRGYGDGMQAPDVAWPTTTRSTSPGGTQTEASARDRPPRALSARVRRTGTVRTPTG